MKKVESADLILKLYDLRREETMRQARNWFIGFLLGISTRGHEKFHIQATRMRDSGLMIADVAWVEEPADVQVPDSCLLLSGFVDRFMDKLSSNYPEYDTAHLDNAAWVSYRLTELLPLKNLERQGLLELTDPVQRLEHILKILPRFQ